MVERQILLVNETGLHARPASMIVREASKYKSEIKIIKDEKEYNAKSIMSVLSMGAIKGDTIKIIAIGEDEKNVARELGDFIENEIAE